MEYMRSTLAFVLFWIDLIVASINIYFSIQTKNYINYSPGTCDLGGAGENLLKINPNYFLEKQKLQKNSEI